MSKRKRPFGSLLLPRLLVAALAALLCIGLTVERAVAAPSLVDQGFEAGVDGSALGATWLTAGAPQRREFDSARAAVGSLSGWIQGPSILSYAGVREGDSAGMSSNGAEQRLWLYFDSTNQFRVIDDGASATADRALFLQFSDTGTIYVYTNRGGNPNGYASAGYTPVGSYSTGWMQLRIVYDFTSQTYTLSKRSNATSAWIPLKAFGATGYGIPFRGTNTITQSHGLMLRGYQNANLWIDDLAYSNSGIVDPDTTAPTVPSGFSASPGAGQVQLSWIANSEPDLAGYNVYRNGARINALPLAGLSYTDLGLVDGTYSYELTAVDSSGNESAKSVARIVTLRPAPTGSPAVVDAGFEDGIDGFGLDSTWSRSGAPQRSEYDAARAAQGARSAWVQGPTASTYAGIGERDSAAMTLDGAEQRLWLYFDTNNQFRVIDDFAASTADRALFVQFSNAGTVNVFTNRSGNPNGYASNAYTRVGTYSSGWMQLKIVYSFSSQTYTLSKRLGASDEWEPLKAIGASGFAIPFRGTNTIAATHGLLLRPYQNANLWLDELAYSNAGLTEPDTSAPATPKNLVAQAGSDQVQLTWTGNTEPDLAGYRVYRDNVLINLVPIAFPLYTDEGLNDGRYAYSVSAVDFLGHESARTPNAFATVDMAVSGVDCSTCHTFDHGDPAPCFSCHGLYEFHAFQSTSDIHVAAELGGDCSQCHVSSLTMEHNGRTANDGAPLDCGSCHASTDARVVSAIQSGTSACSSCHSAASHYEMHASSTAGTPLSGTGKVCGDCHAANLQDEHSKASSSSSSKECDACHPRPAEQLSPYAGGCVQGGCHVAGTSTQMHSGMAAGHELTLTTCDGGGCHDMSGADLADVHMNSSIIENDVERSSCLICHAAGVTPTKQCDTCHGAVHPNMDAAHLSPTNSTCFGTGCHDASKSLPAVHALYAGEGSQYGYDTTCDLCHDNADPDRIDWDLATAQCTGVCHSGATHSEYGAKHTPTPASATCVDCHSSDITEIHGAYDDMTRCAWCHATVNNWTKTADCSSCHAAHPVSASFCTGCHTTTNGTYAGPVTYAQTKHSTVGASTVAATRYPGTNFPTGACANCHGVHTTTRAAGNTLCYNCHDAAGTTKPDTYSYRSASAFGASAHGTASGAQACGSCHAAHGATSGSLVASGLKQPEPNVCAGTQYSAGCHAFATNSVNGVNILSAFSAGTDARNRHDVYATSGQHVVCSSCHDPHTDSRTTPYANPRAIGTSLPAASDRFRDASGNIYALVGAQHDAIGPVVTSSSFYGSASTPQSRSTYWYTDEPSTGYVEYGPTPSYGSSYTANAYLSTYHYVYNMSFPMGTTWYWRYRMTDPLGNTSYGPQNTYRVPWTHLTKAPVITGGTGGAPISVTWNTLGACETWVDFGPTTAYGSTSGSSTNETTHTVTLTGLAPGTYHLRARSVRDIDTYASADYTVTVYADYGTAPVLTPVGSNYDIPGPLDIGFNWTQPNTSYAPFTYQLHVWDPYSSPSFDYTSGWMSSISSTLTLDGDHNYYWTVQARDKDGTLYPLQSPPASFALTYYNGGSGSCPFLYTWDGDEYVFESDEFAAGKLGLNTKTGFRRPNPFDYHITSTQPAPKDGMLEYKLVEERAEVDYLDQVKLYAVDGPSDRDIWVERTQAEGVGKFTSFDAVIHTTEKELDPPRVTWINTGEDVTAKVAADDGNMLMLNEDRNVDYNYQTIELDLGDVQDAPETKLVINGRTCIPTSIAGRQRSLLFGPQVKFEVQDATGKWVSVPTTNTILPKPPEFERPFVLDLSNVWISDSRKVRFTYLYKTYFDSILLDTSADEPVKLTELQLAYADLQPHGFNAKSTLAELYEYVYGDPVQDPTYHLPGYYTKFGRVESLLGDIDDKFVIFGGGDELTLRFREPAAPAAGINRKFMFVSDGFYKDLKQTIDHTVEPLPFAAMSNFPYPETEHYPDDAEHNEYRATWNTRYQAEGSTIDLTPDETITLSSLVETIEEFFVGLYDQAVALLTPEEPVRVASTDVVDDEFSVDTDRIYINVNYPTGSTAVNADAGWQSASSGTALPTPSAPGTAVGALTLADTTTKNGIYWRTDLSSTDRHYNWQLMRFNVPSNLLTGSTGLGVQWTGHGEPTAGYPVKLYLWDFKAQTWVLQKESAGGTDFSLGHTERQPGNEAFCLSCHQASPPAGSAAATGYVNISSAWDVDFHGDRAGSGYGGTLKAPYSRSQGALECKVCHDTHGTSNLYHIENTVNGTAGITVTTGGQYQNLCYACHAGTVDQWHYECYYCHQVDVDHTWGPAITSSSDCSACHKHGRVYVHPDKGCHGCGDPAGLAWQSF